MSDQTGMETRKKRHVFTQKLKSPMQQSNYTILSQYTSATGKNPDSWGFNNYLQLVQLHSCQHEHFRILQERENQLTVSVVKYKLGNRAGYINEQLYIIDFFSFHFRGTGCHILGYVATSSPYKSGPKQSLIKWAEHWSGWDIFVSFSPRQQI